MVRRIRLLHHCALVVALAGCSSQWGILKQAETNPLANQPRLALIPLDWTGVLVDEASEQAWLAGDGADTKAEWPEDKRVAVEHFQRALVSHMGRSVELIAATTPTGPLSIRSRVAVLKTGGFYPLFLVVHTQLLDAKGNNVEEFSTTAEVGGGIGVGVFPNRLKEAARTCGAAVGQYLSQRRHSN